MPTRFENMHTVDVDASIFGGDIGADVDYSADDRGDSFESSSTDAESDAQQETTQVEQSEPEAEEPQATPEPEETEIEQESEQEPEPKQEPEQQKPERGKRNNMVPRDRLNKEIEARRALEARIAQLEAAQKAPQQQEEKKPTVTSEMVARMFESALDGKNDDAVAVLTEILSAHEHAVLEKARGLTGEEIEGRLFRDRANAELSVAAKEVAETYPEFDADSEFFDSGLADEVIAVRDTLIQRGHSPAQALHRAARFVAQENNLAPVGKENPLAKPAKKPVDVAKKVEIANKQPSRLGGTSGQSGKDKLPDVFGMTDKDFDSLSEEQLARLRGDYL